MFTFLWPQMWSELRSQRELEENELRSRQRLLCAGPPPGCPGNGTSPYRNEIILRRNPTSAGRFRVYRLFCFLSDFGLRRWETGKVAVWLLLIGTTAREETSGTQDWHGSRGQPPGGAWGAGIRDLLQLIIQEGLRDRRAWVYLLASS